MARVPLPQRRTPPPQFNRLAIDSFAGLNIIAAPTEIQYNEAVDLQNIVFDDRGNIDKRKGYQRVFENAIDEINAITSLHVFTNNTGMRKFLFTHNDQIYEWFLNGDPPTSIYTGITNASAKWFNYNEKAYMINGNEYLQYDGTTVEEVEPYVPTIRILDASNEIVNLLTGRFKALFAGDGSTTTFTLPLTDLDVGFLVVATYGTTTITEGAGLTVNRSTGVVTFSTAPPDGGGTANLTIEASKTTAGFLERVTNNNQFILHGRNNGQVFLTGNSELQNRIIFSDVARPGYFPETNFIDLASNNTAVTGFSAQYDVLLVFKEPNLQDATIFSVDIVDGVTPLNNSVGCVSGDTIQVIENYPYYLSDKGIYGLANTEIRNERNVFHISDNIDRNSNPAGVQGILDLGDLESYVSYDFDRKYILSNPTSGIAWIYDYRYLGQQPGQWIKWTNIHSNVYIEIDGELYFGDSRKGVVFKFNSGVQNLNDDGEAIDAYFRSKVFTFDDYTRYKLLNRIFLVTTPSSSTRAVLNIRTDRDTEFFNVNTYETSFFQYSTIVYSTWNYSAGFFPTPYRAKVKQKKITEFQFEITNDRINCNLGVTNCTIQYQIQGENKGR